MKGYSWLHDELKASLGYMGLCFKTKQNKTSLCSGSVGKNTCQSRKRDRVWTSGCHVKVGCSRVPESVIPGFLWSHERRGQEKALKPVAQLALSMPCMANKESCFKQGRRQGATLKLVSDLHMHAIA